MLGGKPNHEYIPNPNRAASSPQISFTARDAFSYIVALPLTTLAALFFYFVTLDLATSIFSAFLPYSISLLLAYCWVGFASLAFLFFSKSVFSNISQAAGVRLKLAILNMFRR